VASDATLALQLGPQAFRLTGRSGGADVATEHGEPMDRSIARFVEAVREADQSRVACQPADARDTLAVALACERALASGARVEVAR
jgi:predicted dehydrogenase